MPDKQLVLAVDDRQWAATIQAELAKCIGRPAAECSFESLIDHVGLETDGVVLLAPATATDVEAVRPLVHECYWQQWPVKVFLLPANDLVDNKELAGLLPYIAGQFSWPADTEATLRAESDDFARKLYDQPGDQEVIETVRRVAGARGVSPAQIALAWLLSKPAVAAPIIGATKLHHLDDALAALDVQLSAEEIKQLESPYRPHPVRGH